MGNGAHGARVPRPPATAVGGYDGAMRAVVFGTAGHIDHGKTSLIRRLTGVDTDRLPEEKRRGITLVLGFAQLDDPSGEVEVSFIDVPGHERLVHTMISGAGGIDRALLVVAADEGVMPQTREHLEVLDLLAVRGGVVALTKADVVEDDLVELARSEVEDALAGGPLADAPVIPCSAATGAGVEAVRDALLACAHGVRRTPETGRPFRLAVDRAFTMAGAGTVVTGTARWGSVQVGDELVALPSRRRLRVRGVQVHGARRDSGAAGERVALQLGGAAVDELPRGEQLLAPGPWEATRRLALSLRLLPHAAAMEEGDRAWLHLLAGRTMARVERLWPSPLPPGGEGRAVISLARPVFAAPGDRVVLRRVSPAATLGGGRVLDPGAVPVRRRQAEQLDAVPDPTDDLAGALARWIAEAGPGGVTLDGLAARSALCPEVLEAPLGKVLADPGVVVARQQPPLFLARVHLDGAAARARQLLEEAGAAGLPLAELTSRVVPPPGRTLRDAYLGHLRSTGVLREIAGQAVAADLAPVDDPLAVALVELYRDTGFEAPSPDEAARRLDANPKAVEGMVRFLLAQKRLARIGGKWILSRELLDEVTASLRQWGVDGFDVGEFKDRFGLTRKLAIPLLEWLDSERVTRREGDRRRVLPPRGGTSSRG